MAWMRVDMEMIPVRFAALFVGVNNEENISAI